MKLHHLFAVAALGLLATSASHAASILWQSATTITGDADVSTTGTLLRAYNFGTNTAAVVNGVTFAADDFATVSSPYPLSDGDTYTSGTKIGGVFGSSLDPFNSLSSDYKSILSGARPGGTLTLNNLVVGAEYLVQIWVNDSRGLIDSGTNNVSGRTTTIGDGAGNTVGLNHGTSETAGSVGQYTIGTFTATGTSQTITVSPHQINAFQLRLVPEPASMALSAAGIGLLALRRRRA